MTGSFGLIIARKVRSGARPGQGFNSASRLSMSSQRSQLNLDSYFIELSGLAGLERPIPSFALMSHRDLGRGEQNTICNSSQSELAFRQRNLNGE